MSYTSFNDLALNRQSCRDFNDNEIDLSKLDKAIETALLAPSACNSQPWKIYCATTKESIDLVLDATQEKNRNLFLSKAKAFLVIAEREANVFDDVKKRFHAEYFVKYDVGELIAYLTLALKEQGIESCIIGWVNSEKLKKGFNMGEKENAHIVIAIGHSNAPLRKKSRKDKEVTVKYL